VIFGLGAGRTRKMDTTDGSTMGIADKHLYNGPKPQSSFFSSDEWTMLLRVNDIAILNKGTNVNRHFCTHVPINVPYV